MLFSFMLFSFVIFFVLFPFVLFSFVLFSMFIAMVIAMKRNAIDALNAVDRHAEVAPIACFRNAQTKCFVLKIRIRQEPFFFFVLIIIVLIFVLIFVLTFMVFVMKYCATWNIKIIELRILVRKTEIQTAKIILVRKVVAITVINRLRFQTKL